MTMSRQPKKCRHHACQCARARELGLLADDTGDRGFLVEAIAIHKESGWVPCQAGIEPRRGFIEETEPNPATTENST